MLKHLLIQYRGGGYDGCFWAWNFCAFGDDGQFHDIHSSGHAGCDTEEKILAFMKQERKDKDFYLYNLKSEKQLAEFAAKTNKGLVVGVAKWLYENTAYQVLAACSICGEEFAAEDMRPTDYVGCGGTAVQATSITCEECYSNNSCCYCGEFYSDYEEYFKLDAEEEHGQEYCNEGYCSYCHEQQCSTDSYCKQQHEREKREALIPIGQMDLA